MGKAGDKRKAAKHQERLAEERGAKEPKQKYCSLAETQWIEFKANNSEKRFYFAPTTGENTWENPTEGTVRRATQTEQACYEDRERRLNEKRMGYGQPDWVYRTYGILNYPYWYDKNNGMVQGYPPENFR